MVAARKRKEEEGDQQMNICASEVIPRKNIDGSVTVYVKQINGIESCFNYSKLEAQTMTVDKLEKLVKEHLKDGI